MKMFGYVLGLGLLGLIGIGFLTPDTYAPSLSSTDVSPPSVTAKVESSSEVKTAPVQPIIQERKEVQLSNNNYYTNVDGNSVHSPAYADDIPPGASARCRDGTYSFSQNRRGTCSHHGGVSEWL